MSTNTNRGGRPRDVHPLRYPVRHNDDQSERWKAAAASCGLSLQAWIRATLDAEAAKATHVPMLRREGRRVAR